MDRGTTYSIAIDGKRTATAPSQGRSLLTYSYRPGNDDLAIGRLACRASRVAACSSTQGATLERKEPRKIDGQMADHSVWYKFTARANGRLVCDLSG